jgi:hypothetical protein
MTGMILAGLAKRLTKRGTGPTFHGRSEDYGVEIATKRRCARRYRTRSR